MAGVRGAVHAGVVCIRESRQGSGCQPGLLSQCGGNPPVAPGLLHTTPAWQEVFPTGPPVPLSLLGPPPDRSLPLYLAVGLPPLPHPSRPTPETITHKPKRPRRIQGQQRVYIYVRLSHRTSRRAGYIYIYNIIYMYIYIYIYV